MSEAAAAALGDMDMDTPQQKRQQDPYDFDAPQYYDFGGEEEERENDPPTQAPVPAAAAVVAKPQQPAPVAVVTVDGLAKGVGGMSLSSSSTAAAAIPASEPPPQEEEQQAPKVRKSLVARAACVCSWGVPPRSSLTSMRV